MSRSEETQSPALELIRARIASHRARLADRPEHLYMQAAVAMVLHQPAGAPGPELLFIERAVREGDPWSGQMAFPGGRMAPEDLDMAATAGRETAEEVGVDLGQPIGRLDDLSGSRQRHKDAPQIVVSPYVYELDERPEVTPNHEVQSAVWVPVPWILQPESALEYRYEREDFKGSFPAFSFQGYTVWGLTYRVLEMFFEVLGRRMPSYDGGRAGEEHPK